MALTIGVLGPLAVASEGAPIPLPRPRERAVLALLALAHPAPVGVEHIVTALWGQEDGGTPQTVRSYISRLRHVVGGDTLRSSSDGYALVVAADAIDAVRADRLLADAADALRGGDADAARVAAETALALWRGTPYAELDHAAADVARARLERLRHTGVATLARALLQVGRPARAAEILTPACEDAPLEEPLWALLIRALHADGRRDEALRRHDELRRSLSTELGIDPGEEVRTAHTALLGTPDRPVGPPVLQGYVERDGRALAYVLIGDVGPAVLYLHGGLMASEMVLEEPSAASFAHRMAAGRRLLMVDLGGIGLSDPVDPAVLSHRGWAADIDAVMQALAMGRADVIAMGFSLGPALRLAVDHPHRVRRLVIGNSPVVPRLSGLELEDALAQIDAGQAGRGASAALLAPSRRDDHAFGEWLDRSARMGTRPAIARAIYRQLFGTDVLPLATRVSAPALVLDRTGAVGGGPEMASLAAALPDGRHVPLDGVDALVFVGDVDTWVAHALAFLDDAELGRPVRLMAVAVTAASHGLPVVTVHDVPAAAQEAAAARVAEAGGPFRAVVHAGLVATGGPPSGPAVARAIDLLATAPDGAITTTAVVRALQGEEQRS